MDKYISILESKIEDYFSNITEEKLVEDLEKADYSFYSKIGNRILDAYSFKKPPYDFLLGRSTSCGFAHSKTPIAAAVIGFKFMRMSFADTYELDYKLAA